MVASAGAGPAPIPQKALTSQNLAAAIQFCCAPDVAEAANVLASKVRAESGVKAAVASFHRNLPFESIRCELLPHLPASWLYSNDKVNLRLSKLAGEILVQENKIERKSLKLYVLLSLDSLRLWVAG
jgi:hypothetical protein